ncbi:Serine/threonine-protein kinase Sgk3, partial [Coemansia sp. RSA 475]
MDTSNGNIPTALRHFLARGGPPQHTDMQTEHGAYNHNSATSSATTLQNPPSSRLNSAKSTGNLRSGSTLGNWLSKYHLRPSGGRTGHRGTLSQSHAGHSQASISTSHKETLSRSHAGHSQASISTDHALSAYITSVETREAGATGEIRVSSLRMGRKRFLVYRILVTGHTGQWWVARRYSEFHELYQQLRRQFPQRAYLWGEFPSKRLLPGLSSSADSVMQRRERLNAFLRALIQDPEITAHGATQQFLRDDPLDVDL